MNFLEFLEIVYPAALIAAVVALALMTPAFYLSSKRYKEKHKED